MSRHVLKVGKEFNMAKAMFGAGCFWGVETAFRKITGVMDVIVGYSGGLLENPTYEDVCSNTTGHAEVVQVIFDPQVVTYNKLLDAFFTLHDPTTMNRQGPDIGSQYRSVVFYYDDLQKEQAEKAKDRWQNSGRFARPIVTAIEPAKKFWRAEEYHQRYHEKHGGRCAI